MQIRKLTLPALRELYHTELKATFPPTELKPLFAMQRAATAKGMEKQTAAENAEAAAVSMDRQ